MRGILGKYQRSGASLSQQKGDDSSAGLVATLLDTTLLFDTHSLSLFHEEDTLPWIIAT